MIEFSKYRRNPAAPTLFVNKIARIYRVSPSILKVTYALETRPCRRRRGGLDPVAGR